MFKFNKNMCRVCLVDEAKYSIFEDMDCKESIYYKLCICFKQKLDKINGDPENICDSCMSKLNVAYEFITKFTEASKLLLSEVEHVKYDKETEEIESKGLVNCKSDPDSDSNEQEPVDGYWVPVPIQKTKQISSLTQLKTKLKNLRDINFKKQPKKSKVKSTMLVPKSGNGKSLRSGKIKLKSEAKKQNVKECNNDKKKQPEEPLKKLCDTCGEICNDKYHLLRHRHTKHLMQPKKCPKCAQVLSSNNALDRHLKRKHGERTFICKICGGSFAFEGELASHHKQVHLRIIKKPKKHSCEKCDRHFVTSKALLIHDRSVHTGLRPAECTECDSCFYHEDYLKEHMRIHTGEAPFKCPICGHGCTQRGNLRSHISHNHRLADLTEDTKKSLKPHWFKFLKKP